MFTRFRQRRCRSTGDEDGSVQSSDCVLVNTGPVAKKKKDVFERLTDKEIVLNRTVMTDALTGTVRKQSEHEPKPVYTGTER